MVDFSPDDSPETSGDGTFLDENFNLGFIDYQDKLRCSSFVVDKPPHDETYFYLQLLAVKNYYNSISNGFLDFQIEMIPTIQTLEHNMEYYATSDNQIGLLFSDALDLTNNLHNLNNYINCDGQDIDGDGVCTSLFVVFHAGLGQESSVDFDLTIYDIRSAYIDEQMLEDVANDSWVKTNNIIQGVVLPETLNMIYYDTIESSYLIDTEGLYDTEELEDSYCDYQTGMTGLFAHLLGYAFGFPPLYNIDTGEPRIGKMGLMDFGFYNGRGVIPAPPSAWIRSNEHFNFENTIVSDVTGLLFSFPLGDEICNNEIDDDGDGDVDCQDDDCYGSCPLDIDLQCRGCIVDNIFYDYITKIKITEDEYFLIENRSSSFTDGIPSVDDEWNQPGNSEFWFDILADQKTDYFEIDGGIDYEHNYNVITFVDNYDTAMPGQGILLWHIKEPDYNEVTGYDYGINNDFFNKAISLEEGDGLNDIGDINPFYGWPGQEKYITGDEFDFWSNNYDNLDFPYFQVNNPINGFEEVFFNNISHPNSKSISGATSNLEIEFTTSYSKDMNIIVRKDEHLSFDTEIEFDFIPESDLVIGNNGSGCIYYVKDQINIMKKCAGVSPDVEIESFSNIESFPDDFIGMSNPKVLYFSENEYLVDDINGEYYIDESNGELKSDGLGVAIGYFETTDDAVLVEGALSLGDIDQDGLDEKLYIQNGNLVIENLNGSTSNGFPLSGDFRGVPLVTNLNGDNYPEIICLNDDNISIISNVGDILHEIPSYDLDSNISLVPHWGSNENNDIALVNGNRVYVFKNVYNSSLSYWENSFSRPSNYAKVTGIHSVDDTGEEDNAGIDLKRTYNYPNPIENNQTIFRFFVHDAYSVEINIYDVAGYKVDSLNKNNLTPNEYNEIIWRTRDLPSGLYFANIKSNSNQHKIIKVVIL